MSQPSWKTVGVFISSTFRRMHAERDYLVRHVFPELRQWCETRRPHLVDIHLRLGVTQEQAKENTIPNGSTSPRTAHLVRWSS